jgi:uncharacterized protein YjbI with pentapeptide repeats
MQKGKETEHPDCHCGDAFNDYQKGHIRQSVCRQLPVTYKHGDKYYCIFHFPSEEKKDEFALAFNEKIEQEDYFFNGTWFPQIVDFSGHAFNKWVDFTAATFNHEVSFDDAKFLANCRFTGASFKAKASFSRTVFSNNDEDESAATFFSATFESTVDFSSAKFKTKIDFSSTKFLVGYASSGDSPPTPSISSFSWATFYDETNFAGATFGNPEQRENFDSLLFSEATFEKLANFRGADFILSTHFSNVVFKKTADFRETRIKSFLSFEGASFEGFAKFSGKDNRHNSWPKGSLHFTSVDIEKSEKISFQGVELKPDSFINTDVRKFDFTDIKWKPKNFAFDWSRVKGILFWKEEAKKGRSGYERLEVVYRRLAANAEENARYREASDFRYTAFDIQRITRWYGRLPVTLLWWYKWTSRYGENWMWATIILAGILTAAAYLYTKVDFYVCPLDRPVAQSSSAGLCTVRTLDRYEAGRQSLATATFQNVEHRRPVTGAGETVVLLEKIFAPLQAALIALAIRRKFMR